MNAALLPLVAALFAIIVLVILVTFCRVHPFLSLLIVSIALGLAYRLPPAEVMKQFEKGFGETVAGAGYPLGGCRFPFSVFGFQFSVFGSALAGGWQT